MADIKVYKFGVRWHWRCDHRGKGCHGGPKRTQLDAFAAALGHFDTEHRAQVTRFERQYAEWVAAGKPGLE